MAHECKIKSMKLSFFYTLLLAWSSWWSKLVQDQLFDLIWERLPSYHLK
ncbi:unnamed protein product [Musa acuminata subsp. malaccensis]|uniref:(wild Malaysian banana) hypothetical protein n=1 Tax=Musa acuminata subsp. malaccensis TaxID=214687 RepID=A0A804HYW3_MUSAM|nr:unnamed protein product [Musa acuminata subsp. malaccensis]